MTDADALVERILGAPLSMTREEVTEAAGLTLEQSRAYWRAMGFADVGESVAFTENDLEALRTVQALVDSGVVDSDEIIEIVRSLGQNTSRMAEWQTGTLARLLARHGAIPDESVLRPEDVKRLGELTNAMVPSLERLLSYAWHRQLAAAIQRSIDTAGDEDGDVAGQSCVGFADLVGFTRLSRRLPADRLASLVTTFEGDSSDVVAATGARMVKTLGDEVMFVADTPEQGVETALTLHETHAHDEDVPELRIGLAFGDVVTRMGDMYGSTVNLANRLTVLARPGATLVDDAIADSIRYSADFDVKAMRPRILRGLGTVRAWTVRRAG